MSAPTTTPEAVAFPTAAPTAPHTAPHTGPTTVAPDRWPDLATVPRGPATRVKAAVARRLHTAAVRRLGVEGLRLHRPAEFFARLGTDGLIGFGEAYQTGAWDADDLTGALTRLAGGIDTLVPAWMQRLRGAYVARPPQEQHNTEANTRHNIAAHYDLSNELFALFLDPTLTYSSGLFEAGVVPGDAPHHHRAAPPVPGSDLADAQRRKLDRLLDSARVGNGSRVLEIGTGWGELAIRAAARGAHVTSVTLSAEQQRLARERVAAAGCADAVDVELCDYRAVARPDGGFDAVLSVEMIEAVGHEYWPTYFECLDQLLAEDGVVAIQAITMPHQRMLATRHTWTWIHKYIFPGGFLPSVAALEQVTREHTALRVVDRLSFGSHYAETLRQWDEAFTDHREQVLALGFDDVFCRTWHFYLAYSRAGFASGYLDVQQLTLERPR